MKSIKKLLINCLVLTMLIGAAPNAGYAEGKPYTVTYNGQPIRFDVNPIIDNGSTLVQFRPVFETLGLTITWDEKTKKITGTNESWKVEMQIGSKFAYVNGRGSQLEVAPMLKEGNTMIPLRFISEATGKRVSWDPTNRLIQITRGRDVIARTKQYGDESYDPENYSGQLGNNRPYIAEKDGYIYVIWNRDIKYTNVTYTNFYVSIAKDGKWLKRSSLFKVIQKDKDIQNLMIVSGTSVYWRDTSGVRKVTLNQDTVAFDDYLIRSARTAPVQGIKQDPEILSVVYAGDREGVLFGSKGSLNVYLDSDWNRNIPVRDLNLILTSGSSTAGAAYVLNQDETRLNIFYSNGTVKQLDLTTGDLIYDENGNDKTLKAVTSFVSAPPAYYKGKMYYVYQGRDRRFVLSSVDQNLNLESDIQTNATPSDNSSALVLTQSDTEYHLWSSNDFGRRPALQLMAILK